MSLMMEEQLYAPVAMRLLGKNVEVTKKIAEAVKKNNITSIVFVARGTSNHAALWFKYVCETMCGIKVSKFFHSETTILGKCVDMKNTMVLSVSQSGKSTDTVKVTETAKKNGAFCVSVTNGLDNPLAALCDFCIDIMSGAENSVAATKTFTLTLAALLMLAQSLAGIPVADFEKIADRLADFTAKYPVIQACALRNKDIDNVVVLSRGEMQFLAEELCLKLTETSYKMTRPFSVAEFVHGPIAVLSEGKTVIMLAPKGAFEKDFVAMAKRIKDIGVRLLAFTDIDEIKALATDYIDMPSDSEAAPFMYAMAIQCFACNISVGLGLNPDTPRALNKVTVTV